MMVFLEDDSILLCLNNGGNLSPLWTRGRCLASLTRLFGPWGRKVNLRPNQSMSIWKEMWQAAIISGFGDLKYL